MAEEKEDPFSSIIDQCKYSSSQEDLLRYCLFCRESQEGLLAFSSQESSLPEEPQAASQGLIICSPPDTQLEEEEELQGASQGLIICSPLDTQPEEEEELQVASQGLIICSAPDTQPEEEEELQVASSQGLIICSAPESLPEEEFQTPEERLLLVSSEEQWMDLDEHVELKIDSLDGDTVVFDSDAIDAVGDASPDLDGTVDLGNDSYVNFSEENSVAGNSSPVPRVVHGDGDDNSVPLVEKSPEGKVPIEILPLQDCLGLPEHMSEGLGLSELMSEGGLGLPVLMSEGLGIPEPMGEGLDLPEPMSEGLDDTLSKTLITSEMNLQLLVVNNVDNSVGRSMEICLEGVVEKTIELPVEKNLESLKSNCNSTSMSSPKSPQKSQKIATYENVDDVNAHHDLYFEKDDMLVVHPVTNEVQVLEIAVKNNCGVPMCCTDAVMEDATPIAIEKGLVPETSTEKVIDLDNPQTDVVHNNEGKRGSHNMEGLGEVEKAGSGDISPESEDPPGLRRLPNWVGGKDNAMGNLRQSGKRRVGKADCFNRSGINNVGEVEGSGCGGGRVGEVDGVGCDAGRDEEVDGIDTGRRLKEGTGLGHGGKRTAGEAACSSIVTEALSSGNEYDNMMNLLSATFLRENNQNTGSGRGGGRVEEVGGSGNAGRKLGDGKGSGSHGKETAGVKEIGHGGGRVEEVDGSANAARRSGEGKGSGSHGKKTAGDSEGSSRVTSSGNQSQAMMNLLTSSCLRETNVNKGNADVSNENSQNTEDILEIAIRAGLKFPRPRWWKPEGYETKRYN